MGCCKKLYIAVGALVGLGCLLAALIVSGASNPEAMLKRRLSAVEGFIQGVYGAPGAAAPWGADMAPRASGDGWGSWAAVLVTKESLRDVLVYVASSEAWSSIYAMTGINLALWVGALLFV